MLRVQQAITAGVRSAGVDVAGRGVHMPRGCADLAAGSGRRRGTGIARADRISRSGQAGEKPQSDDPRAARLWRVKKSRGTGILPVFLTPKMRIGTCEIRFFHRL